jgi:AcrR family transcriptional regulator
MSEARLRVLDAAERLFIQRGYASVRLKDIAGELGLRTASLYTHVPGGKEALYVEVLERSLRRYKKGITHAIEEAGDDWRTQLKHAARWMIQQPPMNMTRIISTDMDEISEKHARRLLKLVTESINEPLTAVFHRAREDHKLKAVDDAMLAGAVMAVIQGLQHVDRRYFKGPDRGPERMIDQMIDVICDGLEA